jgi:hypothetical protein
MRRAAAGDLQGEASVNLLQELMHQRVARDAVFAALAINRGIDAILAPLDVMSRPTGHLEKGLGTAPSPQKLRDEAC